MSENLKIRTLLVCEHVHFDVHYEGVHAFGINDVILLNPDTRTNDRHEILIEYDPPLAGVEQFEYRIVRDDGSLEEIFRCKQQFSMPPGGAPLQWQTFLLPSLPAGKWEPGRQYTLEVWNLDRKLASRRLKCGVYMDHA